VNHSEDKESPGLPRPLAGQTALITGGALRMGRAISLALARQGANIVIQFAASATAAEALAAEIAASGVKACVVGADLASAQQAAGLWDRATKQAGPIDILINNASVFEESSLQSFAPEELAHDMQINAVSPLLLARGFFAQGRAGSIINLLDARIADYDRTHAAYHLSKRMLYSLTRMMALEFAPQVRVNAVAPGLILPPVGQDESYLQKLASTNPLNRYGRPADIAEAVLFLLMSPFITGQVIFVDGGRHLKGCVYG
jgi:pteridine reductase